MQEQELNNQDALIARNAATGETGVVTGLKADGTPQMEDPAKSAKFLTFDRRADILDNFLKNFVAQCKKPTLFNFFKVPADQMGTMGFAVNQMAKDYEANKAMLAEAEVKLPDGVKEEQKQDTPKETAKYDRPQPIDEDKINWENLKAWGITKDSLGEQNLKNMLNNRMSDLVKVTPTLGGEKFELEARLSLRQMPDGSVKMVPHFIRQEPNLNDEFHGVKFTKEDKEMLKTTGNLGRVIELKDVKGNPIPSYVSIDRKTNELIALPVAALFIRNKIGETELSPKEIGYLRSGKQLNKEVTFSGGKTFKTVLQVSAEEQKAEFVPIHARLNQQKSQEQGQKQAEGQTTEKKPSLNWVDAEGKIKPIGKWKGVEFTEQQKADYVAGKTVKVDGIPDAKGQPSTLYIRFNPDKQRPYTYSSNPDNAKVITPANESKTQVAVNSEGKTNEATKKVKDPLEQGQTQPKPEQTKKKGQKL